MPPEAIPIHIAIIPDGNRRWAKKNNLPLLEGHRKGIEKIKSVLRWCKEYDIKILSMWGFSSENFSRAKEEIEGLFKLFDKSLITAMQDIKNEDVSVRFFGRRDMFPQWLQDKMKQLEEESKGREYQFNIFLGYGGRQEILDAVNKIIESGAKNIDEKTFSQFVYTKGVPDPDLVIRTSGEIRLSGLMPWQTVYSEFYFSKKLWPDFSKRDFANAIGAYSKRKRRFGR